MGDFNDLLDTPFLFLFLSLLLFNLPCGVNNKHCDRKKPLCEWWISASSSVIIASSYTSYDDNHNCTYPSPLSSQSVYWSTEMIDHYLTGFTRSLWCHVSPLINQERCCKQPVRCGKWLYLVPKREQDIAQSPRHCRFTLPGSTTTPKCRQFFHLSLL